MQITTLASGSSGNAYVVTDGETTLLLEAGIRFSKLREGLRYSLSGIAGCLVSHEHADHSQAVPELVRRGIQVYTSPGTATALHLPCDSPFVYRVSQHQQTRIGSFAVLPFDVRHDCAEPFGYLLHSRHTGEKLVFLTDTFYCPYRFPGLTHIMVECNYQRDLLDTCESPELRQRILRSHMGLETCMDFLRANDLSRCREILLLHLSRAHADEGQVLEQVHKATGRVAQIAKPIVKAAAG